MEEIKEWEPLFEAFCENHGRDLVDSKSKIKKSFIYGNAYKQDLQEKTCLLLSGSEDGFSMEAWKYLAEILKKASYHVITVGANIERKEKMKKAGLSETLALSNKQAVEALANAGIIITDQLLPSYFARREKQEVFYLAANKIPEAKELAEGGRSSLLNCTRIFLPNKELCDTYLRDTRIVSLYQGEVYCYPDSNKMTAEMILELLATPIPSKAKDDKKKILIYCNWNTDTKARNLAISISNLLAEENCDLVLVCNQKIKDNSLQKKVARLPQNESFLVRNNQMAMSDKEYLWQLFLQKMILQDEYREKIIQLLDEEIIQREAKRLFGPVTFDYFLYLGKYNQTWTVQGALLPAKKKIHIETGRNLGEEMPDKVQAETQKEVFASLYEKQVCLTPLPDIRLCLEKKPLYQQEYAGEPYIVAEEELTTQGIRKLTLLPAPHREKESWLMNAQLVNFPFLCEMLTEKKWENVEIVLIYADLVETELLLKKYPEVKARIRLVVDALPETMACFGSYVKEFDFYVLTEEDALGPVRALAELMGLPVKVLKEDGLFDAREVVFKSYEDYHKLALRQISEQILA